VLELGVFAVLVVAYGLVSGRLEGTSITAPMVFVGAGLIAGATGELDIGGVTGGADASISFQGDALLIAAEMALVLVLFTDAARLRLRSIRGAAALPGRLLLVGLPLTVVLGGVVAFFVFDDQLVFWEAMLLAAIVAPTDAALGEQVVTSPRLPSKVRQSLNVESGLNDGLVVPLVTIFLALAVAEEKVTAASAGRVIAEKIGWGVLVGVLVGYGAGHLIRLSARRGWITDLFVQLAVAAAGVITWWAAEEIGGSGFIAAFVGGLVAGPALRDVGETVLDFAIDAGQLLNLFIFFVFGVVTYELLDLVTRETVVFALLALTALRIAPVALALVGTGVVARTSVFIGWFGPRGLATVILGYLVVGEQPELTGLTTITVAASVTVLVSVYAHGISAAPLVNRYADWAEHMDEDAPEMEPVPELPTRMGAMKRSRSADPRSI
jgi:NhaP-type Na+/H+ or K+/H+ antiporter